MNKLKWLVLPLAVLVIATATVVYANGSPTFKKDHLIIAGDANYPPFEFVSEIDGSYRGLNVDVMHAIEDETGVVITLKPMKWEEAKKALREGKVDAIQGMVRTDSRELTYDFSEAYHISSQVIFVRNETHDISGIEDLTGRVVALQRGDVNQELMGNFKNVKLNFYPDQQSALKALLLGDADAVLGNKATGIYHLQRMKEIGAVKIVGETLSINEYGVAVKNGDAATLAIVNAGIKAIKDKGTLKKINYKWFGESIEEQTKWRPLLIVAIFISTGLSILLGLIFWINKRLQTEVTLRTAEVLKMTEVAEQNDMQKWHIINNISSAILVFDATGHLILHNQMSKELIDTKLENEKHWCQIEFCRQLGIEIFDAAMRTKNEQSGNMMMLTSAGQTKYIQYAVTPVLYAEQNDVEIILMVKDNTQEKMLLEIVHQNDKLSAIGRMSASIAHELRNPLNAMKMYVDLMPNRLENSNFMMQALKVLPSEIKRLNETIDGLLDYTKFTQSKRELIFLEEVIEDVATLLKVNLVQKRIGLTSEVKATTIYADAKQIKQVLLNLFLNAIDAMKEDGGQILLKVKEKEGRVIIEVKDNGSGILPENIDKVFESNFTTKKDGYGIGLAISKQLVEENKGKIWIESQIGKGTCVFLEFDAMIKEK